MKTLLFPLIALFFVSSALALTPKEEPTNPPIQQINRPGYKLKAISKAEVVVQEEDFIVVEYSVPMGGCEKMIDSVWASEELSKNSQSTVYNIALGAIVSKDYLKNCPKVQPVLMEFQKTIYLPKGDFDGKLEFSGHVLPMLGESQKR